MTDPLNLIQRLVDALKTECNWIDNPKHDELLAEALASLNKTNPAMTNYQAKPEVWKGFENLYGVHNPFNPLHSEFVDTILELRARLEKLEEAENDRRFRECMTTIKEATPEQIREAAGLPDRSYLADQALRILNEFDSGQLVPADKMVGTIRCALEKLQELEEAQ